MRNLAATLNTSSAFQAFHSATKPSWQIPPLVDKHDGVGSMAAGIVIGYETREKTYKGKPVISEITGKPIMVYRIYVAINMGPQGCEARVIEGSVVMMREIGDAVREATKGARDIPLPGDWIRQTIKAHGEYNGYKTAEWSWSVSAQAISVDDFAALLESDNPMADTNMRIMCDSYGSVREVDAPRGEYKDIAEAMATAYELSTPIAKKTTPEAIAADAERKRKIAMQAHPASFAADGDDMNTDTAQTESNGDAPDTYDPTTMIAPAGPQTKFEQWATVVYGD